MVPEVLLPCGPFRKVFNVVRTRATLWVRAGKGHKDRGVPLPTCLLQELRDYGRLHRPRDYLFVNRQGQPLHPATLQRAFGRARTAAGLTVYGAA